MLKASTSKTTQGTEAAPSSTARRAVARKAKPQGLASDQFFYFFLRLRKGEVRRVVQRAQALYPGESPEQLARRLILAQCSLSLVGGALLYLPQLIPVAGNVLKLAGFVGGASMLARMNLYLILEIALLYGHDIDDQARVPEMMAVVAASGLSAASPFAVQALDWAPIAAIPASAVTAGAVSKLVGEAAIAFYKRRQESLAKLAAVPAA
jgi:hypothetical protein